MEWFDQQDKQLVITDGEAVLSKPLLPDLTAWGGFLTQTQKGLINAFLRRMYKYHFVSECFDIDAILDDMDRKFFKLLFSPAHCLHSLLPPIKSNPYGLRSRDHNLQLPVCNSFSRKSFIIRSLFRFLPSVL